jgi:tetratricopeptide (TPR) repeat protein
MQFKVVGGEAIPFLTQVQKQNPGDFWINTLLGEMINSKSNFPEAIGYYRAALAIRPHSAIVRNNLGRIFIQTGSYDDAFDQFTQGIQADPTAAVVYSNRGVALGDMHRYSEAAKDLREAVRLQPKQAVFQLLLGDVLQKDGDLQEAFVHFQLAKQIDPRREDACEFCRINALGLERLDVLADCWKHDLKTSPPSSNAWGQYAEFCAFTGATEEFESARKQMLLRFSNTADSQVAERIGRACLIRPGSNDEIQQASNLIDRALASKSKADLGLRTFFEVAHGLAQYRKGDFDGALKTLHFGTTGVLTPLPQLVAAMAFYQEGQIENARKMLAAAAMQYDWTTKQMNFDVCMFNTLRREAEAMMFPDLAAVREGKASPQDASESQCLLADDEFKGMRLASSRIYVKAFADDPRLVDNPYYHYRYRAACAAAMAGCGRAVDGARLSPNDQRKLREQSLTWLQAELADWAQRKKNSDTSYKAFPEDLAHWRNDRDLAGVRDAGALAKLDGQENAQWSSLWAAVNDRIDSAELSKSARNAN